MRHYSTYNLTPQLRMLPKCLPFTPSPDDPEALDSLAENELYCIVECEGQKCETTAKRGITWNESFTFYLTSPVTSKIECKVSGEEDFSLTF